MSNIEILIADGNDRRGRRVATALEAAGHRCEVVGQGAAALEVALAEHPRVVVAPFDLALVDASKLSEILRANPRTRSVRFLFIGAPEGAELPVAFGDAGLSADAETNDILEAVSELMHRQESVEDLQSRADTELAFSGVLAELGPAELLRMLHLRGATGTLDLMRTTADGPPLSGRVRFFEGELFAAEIGEIRGQKALYRILAWPTGEFDFEPGPISGAAEISAPTRQVLAEGLRQVEESRRLADQLPPLEAPVRVSVGRGDLPQLVHPLTQDVLRLLEDFDRVGDVVDHCRWPDYQVLRTLHTLAGRGIAEIGHARIAPPDTALPGTLFNEAQIRRLRSYTQRGLDRDAVAPDAKLVVVASSPKALARFVGVLAKVPDVELAPAFAGEKLDAPSLETMARIQLDDGFGVDLVHLPSTPAFAPVCDLAGHRALGTLMLLDAEVGRSASAISKTTQTLAGRSGARSFNVVMLGEGERVAPEELRENLSLIDEASLFLLPVEEAKDSGPLMRTLFARIVP